MRNSINAYYLAPVALLALFIGHHVFAQAPPAGLPSKPGTATVGAAPAAGNPPGGGKGKAEVKEEMTPGNLFAGVGEPFEYDDHGRPDPFVQPIPDRPVIQGGLHGPLLPLQKFNLDQLRLTGVIWDVRHPKAMLLDPTQRTHIVGLNTKIGPRNGYVAVIREGEIVVVETEEQDGRLVSVAQVMKLGK